MKIIKQSFVQDIATVFSNETIKTFFLCYNFK